MKKILFILIIILFISCDYILKNSTSKEEELMNSVVREQVNDDSNEHDCELKAGYKWSNISKKCVRVFDEGYRIISIEKDSLGKSKNAYFFIHKDSLVSEIFLPDSKESIIFTRKNKNDNFKFENFIFKDKKGFKLYYNDVLLFEPAVPIDTKVLGKDEEQ